MAKAQVIGGLSAQLPARAALPRIFSVRIAELWGWSEHMLDPMRVRELHDMRIAAKRLRYCFEFFLPCFGESFKPLLKQFKVMQDYLGEIHDCDVWVDYLRDQLSDTMREQHRARKQLRRFIGASNIELGREAAALRELLAQSPAQGLLMLIEDVVARRERLYAELLKFWQGLEDSGFRLKLSKAVAQAASIEPPPVPPVPTIPPVPPIPTVEPITEPPPDPSE